MALALLLAGSWRPAWSRDEAATAMVVRRPLEQVWRSWAFDPALEPFYLMIDLWAVVSTSELWLRLPAVLAAAATVPLLAALVNRFVAPPAGQLGALFFLLLPATSRYGQEARPYALTMLVATVAVLVWDANRTVRGWAAHLRLTGLLVGLGLLHGYALVLVLVLLIVALVAPVHDRRTETVAVLRVGVLTLLTLFPFLWLLSRRAVGAPYPSDATAINLGVELVRLPAGVLRPPAAPAVGILVLLVAASGIVVGWRRGGRARTGAVLAASWLLVPPAALCLLQGATSAPGLVARYWTFSLPAFGLAGAFVLDAAWSRRRGIAAGILVVAALLGVPTQLAIRGPNGHAGAGWRELPTLLEGVQLAGAALLVEGSVYRVLVANRPAVADRMPLVADPAPAGRIQPQIAGPTSAHFKRLATSYEMVVLVQNRPSPSAQIPSKRDFVSFRPELQVFPHPAVLCSFFGFPLGVFVRPTASLEPAQADQLAQTITAVDPEQVTCSAHAAR